MKLQTGGSNEVRVLLVKPYRLFGEAIKQMLESEGIQVVGTCRNASETLDAIETLDPTMVVIGSALGDTPGIELGRHIVQRHPEMKVMVILSGNDNRRAREVIDSGLNGCITRESTLQQLLSSITAICEGNVIMPPRTDHQNGRRGMRNHEDGAALLASHLTQRERQVLTLLLRGASSKEIAKRLALRPNTVRTHVQNVLTKLQVHSRLEAAAVASRLGLHEELDELAVV